MVNIMVSVYARKQEALKFLAFASLKNWNEPTDFPNISAEKSRIERVISDQYIKSKSEKEYNQFVLDFIREHGEEIVYTDQWTYDIEIPEEPYELNVNTIIDKYTRKKAGAKY